MSRLSESLDPGAASRLSALLRWRIVDTPPEPEFDAIARFAAAACETPIATVFFLDEEREWFKAVHGWNRRQLHAGESWQHLLPSEGMLLEISDTAADSRLRQHPLLAHEQIRFYAAAYVRTPEGFRAAGVSVYDSRPRVLTAVQRQSLTMLASHTAALLEERSSRALLAKTRRELREAERIGLLGRWHIFFEASCVEWSPMVYEIFGLAESEFDRRIESVYDMIHPEDRDKVWQAQEEARRGVTVEVEHRIVRRDGAVRWVLERAELSQPTGDDASDYLAGTIQDITERKNAADDARRAAAAQEAIVEVQARLVSTGLAFQEAAALVAREAAQLMGAQGALVKLTTAPGGPVQAAAGLSAPLLLFEEPGPGGGLVECADTADDTRVDAVVCGDLGVGSVLVAPVWACQKCAGFLQLVYQRPSGFSRLDLSNLQILAGSLSAYVERRNASSLLQRSADQYRLLFNRNPHPMWTYDAETLRVVAVNAAAVAHYGYSEEEFLQLSIRDLRSPEEWPALADMLRQGVADAVRRRTWRHRKKDRTFIDVEITSDRVIFEGRPARLVLAHDVTDRLRVECELRQVHRAQMVLSGVNEALLRAEDELSLLTEICRVAVDIGGYKLAWAGYLTESTVTPVAHVGDGERYLSLLPEVLRVEDDSGSDPVIRTLNEGKAAVARDIAAELPPSPHRDLELAHGYRGVICLPWRVGERTPGVLCLHSGESLTPHTDELALLQRLADNLSYGIGRLRSQSERDRIVAAVSKVAAGVSGEAGEEFFQNLMLNMADALGAQAGFVASLQEGARAGLRTIAVVMDGKATGHFEFELGGDFHAILQKRVPLIFQEPCELPWPFRGGSGQTYVAQRLENSQGEPLGVLFAVFRDALQQTDFTLPTLQIFAARAAGELERQVADRKSHEQASLLDKAKDAIIVRGMDGRIEFWNKGAERLFGWTAEEAQGRLAEELLRPEASRYRRAGEQLLQHGEWSGELQQRQKSGGVVTVETNWTLVRDDQGRSRSVLSIQTDITRRLAIEQQLRQSQRLESVGQLTGGIAHDFNNLLTVILGNSELLVDQLADNKRLVPLAEMIRTAATRCADLTHRLLAFARLQTLEPRVIDVNQLLVEMEALLRRTLSEAIDIRFSLANTLWHALVDPSQLEGVLLNLCINARDAMPGGGGLSIATGNIHLNARKEGDNADVQDGPYVMIAVSDTGAGIPPEILNRVFEPFFTTKPKGKGTGLGLSMAYGFVKQSQGHMKIESQVGQGTTVRIFLPAAAGALDEPEATPEVRTESAATHKILLAEDDELVRTYAEDQLVDLGYRVVAVRDGTEALAVLQQDPDIDLLFTDVIMPGGINGQELANAARLLRPDLKVLYTSGYTDNAMAPPEGGGRRTNLLNKPYRRTELAQKIRAVLIGSEEQESDAG